ncbi:MAG: biopolymer transporter ExbD [Planctomycetota bacterium]
MRKRPRHDLSPRIELMPLIDVVFLLLTFFIYALAVMVRAEVLPFELAEVTGGQRAEPAELLILAIGPGGEYIWDGTVVSSSELDQRLEELGKSSPDDAAQTQSMLFITMSSEALANDQAIDPATGQESVALNQAVIDRGPVMFDLMQRLQRTGVERWSLVGLPGGGGDE